MFSYAHCRLRSSTSTTVDCLDEYNSNRISTARISLNKHSAEPEPTMSKKDDGYVQGYLTDLKVRVVALGRVAEGDEALRMIYSQVK